MMTTRLRSRAVSADDTRWKREQLGFQCAGFCTGDEIAGVTQCCADQEQARSVPGQHTGDEIASVTPTLRRSGTGAKRTRPAYRRRDRRRYPDAAPIRKRREAYPASMPATRSPALPRCCADQEQARSGPGQHTGDEIAGVTPMLRRSGTGAKWTRPAYRRRDRRRYPDAAPIRNRREAYPASMPATRSPALSRRRADQEKAKRTRPAYRRRDRRRYPDAAPIRKRREGYPASIPATRSPALPRCCA